MSRPMSEVLGIILARGELVSSILIGLDDCLKYGDITRIEHTTANRMVGRWMAGNPTIVDATFGAKKESFKSFIKGVKKNESLSIR